MTSVVVGEHVSGFLILQVGKELILKRVSQFEDRDMEVLLFLGILLSLSHFRSPLLHSSCDCLITVSLLLRWWFRGTFTLSNLRRAFCAGQRGVLNALKKSSFSWILWIVGTR